MIKKIIACLTICFIITGIISPVFSDASALPQPNWADPGISEIINISDLTGWMLNGGTYDVSTYTDAESFMNDYYSARTKTRLEGSDYEVKHYYGIEELYYDVGDSAYVHPLDVNRAISSAFRDHVGYGRRFSEQVNDALLSTGHLYDTKIPLLNEIEFANFVNYNHDALRLYNEFFVNEDPGPNPNPDPNYITYLERLNKREHESRYFWWYDCFETYQRGNYYGLTQFPTTSFSWWTSGNNSSGNGFGSDSAVQHCSDILTLNINSTNDVYFLDITVSSYNPISWVNAYRPTPSTYYNAVSFRVNNNTDVWPDGRGDNITSFNFSTSGTLSQVLEYCCNHFKNVNIYVDGELWALASVPPISPTITPEFPDAIGGEDLPSTTWPVHRPLAPYFITAPGMLQAIQDAIDDDGKLDIDDLKPYLTDENGDPVPDPQFDPEPVPIPVPDPVNPDVVPGLPILPAMPPEMPGFSGVSVLAEIINFTNQSLPTALIVTFWGIVFGIVILGLIKILHK